MRRSCWRSFPVFALLSLLAASAHGQSLVGVWQGTLREGPRPLRMKFDIARSDDRGLAATLWSIDEGGFDQSFHTDTVMVYGRTLRLTLTPYHVRYVATVGGGIIRGTWTEQGKAQPLELVRATSVTEWRDSSPHRRRFVNVEKTVKLETLDWGGTGRPVVLLAGAGNTAHVFDEFAPKLTDRYHVYAITRRGFGASSAPTWGYLADSLGDDVLAVLDSLHLQRPVLIGHSIAGEELSSIGSRHPERVAGLVYLDAAYPYAYYDSSQVSVALTIHDMQHKLGALLDPLHPLSPKARQEIVAELLDAGLPQMERDLRAWKRDLATLPNQSATPMPSQSDRISQLLGAGAQKYTSIRAPALAIFASPHEVPETFRDSAARARWDSTQLAQGLPQIRAFERGVPSARVVRLPHANHYVFRSNEAEVLQEIRAFIDALGTR
jgi:Predicted hydrolases or acyltransferases (alpha/beta hydrolase superfamily)